MTEYLFSEATAVERGLKQMVEEPRYNFCGHCHYPLIKTVARGYQAKGGHQTIEIGYWCRKCKTLYVSDTKVRVVNYKKTVEKEGITK